MTKLRDFTCRIDNAPQVDHFAIELNVRFVQMPARGLKLAHAAYPLAAHLTCKHRPEPVPP